MQSVDSILIQRSSEFFPKEFLPNSLLSFLMQLSISNGTILSSRAWFSMNCAEFEGKECCPFWYQRRQHSSRGSAWCIRGRILAATWQKFAIQNGLGRFWWEQTVSWYWWISNHQVNFSDLCSSFFPSAFISLLSLKSPILSVPQYCLLCDHSSSFDEILEC